jgi:hypothetical protein
MPHGAVSARADQKTHKKPTSSPGRRLPPRPGEGPPHSTQPRLRERSRAPASNQKVREAALPVHSRGELAVKPAAW